MSCAEITAYTQRGFPGVAQEAEGSTGGVLQASLKQASKVLVHRAHEVATLLQPSSLHLIGRRFPR